MSARLRRLTLANFRCFEQVSIEPGAGVNLLLGPNGAGKTSLLESLFFLSRAQSFRTRRREMLIRHNQHALRLQATLSGVSSSPREVPLVLAFAADEGLQVRIDREPVRRLSVLAQHLPVLLIDPAARELVAGSPRLRRRLLDWSLFHAAPTQVEAWRRYMLALRQRNAALRGREPASVIRSLAVPLAAAAGAIHGWREGFARALQSAMAPLLDRLLGREDIRLRYQSGWPAEQEFAEVLAARLERDRQAGLTGAGPHRADLRPLAGNQPVAEVLSGGEQKLVAAALVLAQAQVIAAVGRDPVLLVDDLPAELDAERRAKLAGLLREMPVQQFWTALAPGLVDAGPARCFEIGRSGIKAML
ncbi:MAG TPA: DNA replication/repair protein RecF [Gammaproteobacteria bacterium]|nr:DNA replication/repair protein RecF [Gammaproteobacteria bacterium]